MVTNRREWYTFVRMDDYVILISFILISSLSKKLFNPQLSEAYFTYQITSHLFLLNPKDHRHPKFSNKKILKIILYTPKVFENSLIFWAITFTRWIYFIGRIASSTYVIFHSNHWLLMISMLTYLSCFSFYAIQTIIPKSSYQEIINFRIWNKWIFPSLREATIIEKSKLGIVS